MKDDYAFPRVTNLGEQAPGMELRDWFAAKFMSALIIADMDSYNISPSNLCDHAYEVADLMMVTRNR